MSVILRGERLELSLLGRSDMPALVTYRQQPEVARLQGWAPEYAAAEAAALMAQQPDSGMPPAGGWSQWGIRLMSSEPAKVTLVGDVGIGLDETQPDTFELGITLAEEHQGAGYAAEALDLVIDWLMREHAAHRIVMRVDARNRSMLSLAGRVGLRHEGTVVEGDWFKGEWSSIENFALLRREWSARGT